MIRAAALALAVVLATTASSCSDDDPEPRSDPTTTAPTTTADQPTDEEQIRQLVEEWWQVSREIHARERPVDDAEAYITGEYLNRYRQGFDEYVSGGLVDVLSDDSSIAIELAEVNGDEAVVEMCAVDADQVQDELGDVVDNDVVAERYKNDLVRVEGGWRIELRQRLEVLEVPTCE